MVSAAAVGIGAAVAASAAALGTWYYLSQQNQGPPADSCFLLPNGTCTDSATYTSGEEVIMETTVEPTSNPVSIQVFVDGTPGVVHQWDPSTQGYTYETDFGTAGSPAGPYSCYALVTYADGTQSTSNTCELTTGGGTTGSLILEISGESGNLALACDPCATVGGVIQDDIALQIAGASPNGQVAFFLSESAPGAWDPLLDPETGQPFTATADAFGNLTVPWSSCYLQAIHAATSPYAYGVCPGAGSQPSFLYLVAQDVETQDFSYVLTLTGNCNSGNCCQGC